MIPLLFAALTAVTMLAISACSPLVNYPGADITAAKIEKTQFITTDGSLLPLRSWLPRDTPVKAVIIALHGFNDYSNFFTSSGNFLSSRGIACYAYDQRGFGAAPGRGLWAGVEAYTNDLTAFAAVVRKLHHDIPLYVLGDSMGGAVTIVAMTGSNPPDVDGAILVAPAVWGRDTMPWYQRWLLAVGSHTVPWMELTGKGIKITPSDNIEMLRKLGRDPLVIKATRIDTMYGLTNLMDAALVKAKQLKLPTLVQYGEHDQVIPRKPLFLMLEQMPATTRKAFYKNGYHMLLRDLQGEKPLTDIAAWIADHTRPLPYGTDTWQGAGTAENIRK
jgi:alpha-beta hydrolase superfamily lysophospholipase